MKKFSYRPHTEPVHYIHRDLNPGNILKTSSGVYLIDWDMSHGGHREDDVAMSICCLASMVEGEKTFSSFCKEFLNGYRRRIPAEWAVYNSPTMVSAIALAGLRQAVSGWFSDKGCMEGLYWDKYTKKAGYLYGIMYGQDCVEREINMELRRVLVDSEYIILNCIISKIPCWTIRKLFYKLFGMKIGDDARIGINTVIMGPRNITIGKRAVINEFCFLDGRGGLRIGNDVSISTRTTILTATHIIDSPIFQYIEESVIIKDNVWLAVNVTILGNSIVKEKMYIRSRSCFLKV